MLNTGDSLRVQQKDLLGGQKVKHYVGTCSKKTKLNILTTYKGLNHGKTNKTI